MAIGDDGDVLKEAQDVGLLLGLPGAAADEFGNAGYERADIGGELARAIAAKTVTYDFARLMEGAKKVSTSEFGDAIIAGMTP